MPLISRFIYRVVVTATSARTLVRILVSMAVAMVVWCAPERYGLSYALVHSTIHCECRGFPLPRWQSSLSVLVVWTIMMVRNSQTLRDQF